MVNVSIGAATNVKASIDNLNLLKCSFVLEVVCKMLSYGFISTALGSTTSLHATESRINTRTQVNYVINV